MEIQKTLTDLIPTTDLFDQEFSDIQTIVSSIKQKVDQTYLKTKETIQKTEMVEKKVHQRKYNHERDDEDNDRVILEESEENELFPLLIDNAGEESQFMKSFKKVFSFIQNIQGISPQEVKKNSQ